MNLPVTPPAWLKNHPTALKSWRRFALRRAEGPVDAATQRRIDLLAGYCEMIDHALAGNSSAMEAVAMRMDALTSRGAANYLKTPMEFRAALQKTLRSARAANNGQARAAQLARALGVELEAPAYDAIPELRNLIRAILPVGEFVLAEMSKPSSSRKIQITYSSGRIRKG
jgi:hypothetical protein